MNYKYYDLLSCLTVGVIVFYAAWRLLFPDLEINEWVVVPGGYVVGYLLNALSSLIETPLYKSICGKPSDKLLTPVPGQKWTGTKKVKFYFADKAVELLKKDTQDDDATTDKMFGYAMRMTNSANDTRVPDFNGHYALSRVILTTVILAVIIIEIRYYNVWYSWLISIPVLILAWIRFKERGYYYAREVLNEYLKLKENTK